MPVDGLRSSSMTNRYCQARKVTRVEGTRRNGLGTTGSSGCHPGGRTLRTSNSCSDWSWQFGWRKKESVTLFFPGPRLLYLKMTHHWLYLPQPVCTLFLSGRLLNKISPVESPCRQSHLPLLQSYPSELVSPPVSFQYPLRKTDLLTQLLASYIFLGLTNISWGVAWIVWCRWLRNQARRTFREIR